MAFKLEGGGRGFRSDNHHGKTVGLLPRDSTTIYYPKHLKRYEPYVTQPAA